MAKQAGFLIGDQVGRESRELNPYGEPLWEQPSDFGLIHVCGNRLIIVGRQ